MNTNDAFSAFRLGGYNNFLRIKIKGDQLEIYAVGLTKVPKRDDWVANSQKSIGNPDEPAFLSAKPLQPHLIEKIHI